MNSVPLFNEELISNDFVIPGGLSVRSLHNDDYKNGFLELLGQLTSVGDVTEEEFVKRFESMRSSNSYYIVVIEEIGSGKIVAAATLVAELKFIHQAGCRGRIEDVVVDTTMRGKKLGVLLNEVLVNMAQKLGVYKLSLECTDKLVGFYEKFGYKKDVNFLVQRFEESQAIELK